MPRSASRRFRKMTSTGFKWYGVYRQRPKDSGYFMLRTKIPGGQLTSAQPRRAGRHRRGFRPRLGDITTRQTIQFHWLRIEDFPEVFERLSAVGITTSGACGDDTRNVVGCPVAGIDPERDHRRHAGIARREPSHDRQSRILRPARASTRFALRLRDSLRPNPTSTASACSAWNA